MEQFQTILDLLQSVGIILLVVFFVALVLWTYKDARKRIDDPILVATATAAAMIPIVGVLLYLLLRPSEYLADVRERELEIRMMERTLGRQERCSYCKSHVEGDYLACPVCTTKLREQCTTCERPLDPRWVMCPICETEVPGRARRTPPATPARAGRAGRDAGAERPRERDRSRSRTAPAARGGQRSSSKPSPTAPTTPGKERGNTRSGEGARDKAADRGTDSRGSRGSRGSKDKDAPKGSAATDRPATRVTVSPGGATEAPTLIAPGTPTPTA